MIRRPLAALTVLAILASSLGGLASVARAQQPTINNLGNLNDSFTPSGPSGFLPSTIIPDTKSPAAPPPSTDTQKKDSAAEKKPTSSASSASTPSDEVYGSVMVQIMGLFAMLLGIAVVTLDNAVYYTVVDMGKYLKNLSAVGVSWRILRDIGNVILIFGFLVIGISVILDLNIYGYGTKMLPTLLIAAVFLNFSLFISEAVIDAGNLFATQFYTQINGGAPPAPVSYRDAQGEGISNRIMGQLGLTDLYAGALKDDPQHSLLGKGTPWYVGFLGILLFLVAAFVIFSLAFILIARFVILVFLIIVAPIGFAGLAVPKLEKSARDWWGQLFEQTITAPILLLMLYVALAVITDANFLTGLTAPGAQAQWTGIFTGNTDGFAGLMLSFLVAMGLLLAVTVLAKRLGAFGAWATKWGSRLSGMGLAAAGVGFVGRSTVGALGNSAANRLKRTSFGRSFIGRGLTQGIENRVAKASFDIRNTGIAKSALGVGLDLGKGQKGGYKADLAARMKAYQEAADSFKDREKTQEEKDEIKQADANEGYAKEKRDEAKAEKESAGAESAKQKEELARLNVEKEKDPQWMANLNNYKKLQDAQRGVETSDKALEAANQKLAAAEEHLATRTAEAAKTKNTIEGAIKSETKEAQQAYAKRLETFWGGIPLFGGPFRDAAKSVRKNIGKSKDQRDNEKLLKQLKQLADKAEDGGGGSEEKPAPSGEKK